MAIQTDGKIIVIGTLDSDFTLLRYTSAGVLDTIFGTSGIVITDIGTGTADQANSVVVQPDGKIVVAGSSASDFAVLRYTSAGVLDTTFGTSGKKVVDIGTGTADQADCVAIQPDGKIVVAGNRRFAGDDDFAMIRLWP